MREGHTRLRFYFAATKSDTAKEGQTRDLGQTSCQEYGRLEKKKKKAQSWAAFVRKRTLRNSNGPTQPCIQIGGSGVARNICQGLAYVAGKKNNKKQRTCAPTNFSHFSSLSKLTAFLFLFLHYSTIVHQLGVQIAQAKKEKAGRKGEGQVLGVV